MRGLSYKAVFPSPMIRLSKGSIPEQDELRYVAVLPLGGRAGMKNPMVDAAIAVQKDIEESKWMLRCSPKRTKITDICERLDDRWCALCLRKQSGLTLAHVLPIAFRREHNYAHYKIDTISKRIPVRITVPLADMCVFLCSACREYEEKVDAAWSNVLYTHFPVSHGLVRSKHGPYIKREENGSIGLYDFEEDVFSKGHAQITIMSPQPMLVQLAKWKASYFQRLYTTLMVRDVFTSKIRREVYFSRARRRISVIMRMKQPDPVLVDWEFRDQPFPENEIPLNWIQLSARLAVPRASRPAKIQHEQSPKKDGLIREGQFVINLVPAIETLSVFLPLPRRIIMAISNWFRRSVRRGNDIEAIRQALRERAKTRNGDVI